VAKDVHLLIRRVWMIAAAAAAMAKRQEGSGHYPG